MSFQPYVMPVEAIEVRPPFSAVAKAIGGQVLLEGRKHVGVIMPNRKIAFPGWFVVRRRDGIVQGWNPAAFSEMFVAADPQSDNQEGQP